MTFSVTIVTVSDSAAAGERSDRSGDTIEQMLAREGFGPIGRDLVADERGEIEAALVTACSSARLVVTTGGTGLGPRDVTPEATLAVIERQAPGLAEVMRAAGSLHTPFAALSRGVVGARGASLIVNLPGSAPAVEQNLESILPLLPHALETLSGHTSHG